MVFLRYLHAELFRLWLFTCIFINFIFHMYFLYTLPIAKGLQRNWFL